MRNFNSNTANNQEWLTPPDILRALGPFDLDPCAPVNRPWDMAANAPSCLVSYGDDDTASIAAALDAGHINGRLVRL